MSANLQIVKLASDYSFSVLSKKPDAEEANEYEDTSSSTYFHRRWRRSRVPWLLQRVLPGNSPTSFPALHAADSAHKGGSQCLC